MIKLFLLKPDFTDSNADNEGKLYYCPHNAIIEGVIKYYPKLEEMIDINYVDFKRPRPAIIEIIGEGNQSCPVLIIGNEKTGDTDTSYFEKYGDKLFVNSPDFILKYFAEKFGIGLAHQ